MPTTGLLVSIGCQEYTVEEVKYANSNGSVKVNPRVVGKAYDRGLPAQAGHSGNSNSFQHHSDITNGRNIYILGGDSDMKANGRVGILRVRPRGQ